VTHTTIHLEATTMAAFELGDRVEKGSSDLGTFNDMAPPVVFHVQPDSFIRLESPDALRSWEKAVRMTSGVDVKGDNLVGTASESCSAGCSDDCDVC